ncbi:hypothetical protein I552_6023 [Mycobacterium xenopi 3993]|nr:hypothetical protein I552_6023 [Mycobacterium xenopi 3993]
MLKIVNRADVEIDTLAVLEWSLSGKAADGLSALAARGGANSPRCSTAGWRDAPRPSPDR